MLDDISEFNGAEASGEKSHTQFLVEKAGGVSCVDGRHLGLGLQDLMAIPRLFGKTEEGLERSRIRDHFHEGFFKGDYWLMLATT